eukprot:gnl/TRDRNA2_/TRDRNA2_43920_c0_seq2.p1 gnl/TRDRNA2_/TRDRNA2_43920_c0~~gnl/TRDRNA2_/TRDRNA2_43920_c0_seq2.p1  ORF type:complete len:445 (-),score=51.58 gnl/TRDRNA2_/TRDRNA2_43920_c0_seq2:255-1502(-)
MRANALTVVLDHNGDPRHVFEPGVREITVSVLEVFSLLGLPNFLDEPRSELKAPNFKASERFQEGPPGRITGLEVTLNLRCFDEHKMDLSRHRSEWEQLGEADVICYVSFAHNTMAWSAVTERDAVNHRGDQQNTIYYGIRVQITHGGTFWFPDANTILVALTAVIVMLSIPSKVLQFVATDCLGHLSTIYKSVIKESFSFSHQITGIATRLMGNTVLFHELHDMPSDVEGEYGSISQARMSERLSRVLGKGADNLDKHELEQFSKYCFSVLSGPAAKEGTSSPLKSAIVSDYYNALARNSSGSTSPKSMGRFNDAAVDIISFNAAALHTEQIQFQHIVNLFDRHRKLQALERFFFPYRLQQYIYGAESQTDMFGPMIRTAPTESSSVASPLGRSTLDQSPGPHRCTGCIPPLCV